MRLMKKETIMQKIWKFLAIRPAHAKAENLYQRDPMAHPAISAMDGRTRADLPTMRYHLDRE